MATHNGVALLSRLIDLFDYSPSLNQLSCGRLHGDYYIFTLINQSGLVGGATITPRRNGKQGSHWLFTG
ncbi:MAG: hypothetical protein NZ901_11270 [Geminocystis sp.]|nr:hypothetical protein [Geminocystis sp.]MCS7148750.1 hypothetical protein [Geminocystis sp.]MDW8116101.1 hypothetical protein [Geminocystis sp.]MDW8463559.1 hypothetical protein [Geminocystis sp.]